MPDLRANIAKDLSNIPRPKISKPINLSVESPELWDQTQEVGISKGVVFQFKEVGINKDVVIQFEEARIPQPVYDVASSAIPLGSYVTLIDINPSTKMDFLELNVDITSVRLEAFDA